MWKAVDGIVHFGRALSRVPKMQRRQESLLHEVRRLNEQVRALKAGAELDQRQTRESFDFQWHELPEGAAHPSDEAFMAQAQDFVSRMTDLPREWFAGKRIVDVGCGIGRFTLPMLETGARVTACDQSEWALKRTSELCAAIADRLETQTVDLLTWDGLADFGLAFGFGVVHHTGDTYRAIRNVARKVGEGGRLFLMVYGFPSEPEDFVELNTYERLRQELRGRTLSDKRRVIQERYEPDLALGYFDAVSPRINDLLTFEEIFELLSGMGFEDIHRTLRAATFMSSRGRQRTDSRSSVVTSARSGRRWSHGKGWTRGEVSRHRRSGIHRVARGRPSSRARACGPRPRQFLDG